MSNVNHFLYHALKALQEITENAIKQEQVEKAGKTIQTCAITAAATGVGAAILPGGGGFVLAAAAITAVWVMYVKINKDLGISISDNKLKSLASAILSNIITNAGSLLLAFVATAIFNFIPGLNVLIAPAQALIAYIAVFTAGILYIKLLTKAFKAKGKFDFDEDNIKQEASDIVNETDMKSLIEDIKESYDKDKVEREKNSK